MLDLPGEILAIRYRILRLQAKQDLDYGQSRDRRTGTAGCEEGGKTDALLWLVGGKRVDTLPG